MTDPRIPLFLFAGVTFAVMGIIAAVSSYRHSRDMERRLKALDALLEKDRNDAR
jgi:hypothetical protein